MISMHKNSQKNDRSEIAQYKSFEKKKHFISPQDAVLWGGKKAKHCGKLSFNVDPNIKAKKKKCLSLFVFTANKGIENGEIRKSPRAYSLRYLSVLESPRDYRSRIDYDRQRYKLQPDPKRLCAFRLNRGRCDDNVTYSVCIITSRTHATPTAYTARSPFSFTCGQRGMIYIYFFIFIYIVRIYFLIIIYNHM